MKLCILMPAKNESASLPETISRIDNILKSRIPYGFLIIDDHSFDDTNRTLELLSKKYTRLAYFKNELDGGVGNAIKFGLSRWEGDIVSICMADGSEDPQDIVTSYDHIARGDCDCVFGSRFIKGSTIIDYPGTKRVLNRIFNTIVKWITNNSYNDYTNIFKTYHRKAIESIQPIESSGFSIGLEMSLKILKTKMRVKIIPIHWKQRKTGKSKLKIIRSLYSYFSTLIRNM